MGVLNELLTLSGEALTLWRRNLGKLITWFCLGTAVHIVGTQLSARIGNDHQLLSTMAFILGVLGWLAAQVLMIHSLKPNLTTPRRLLQQSRLEPATGQARRNLPNQIFADEGRMLVLVSAIGPFLAVYSVWGYIQDEVRDLFFANLSQEGSLDPDHWSISFATDRLPFYLGLTVGAWIFGKLVEVAVARIRRHHQLGAWTGIAEVIADGTVVFGLFMLLGIAWTWFKSWWQDRAVTVGLETLWRAVLGVLPDWQLWFGLTLPVMLQQLVGWCAHTLLPGLANRVLLPLMWLALTGTVFGWRQFAGRDVVTGTRLERAAERLGRVTGPTTGAVGMAARFATDDLRTKWLPVAYAFRLVWRSGPRFLGSYLVLATVLWAAQNWLTVGLTVLIGPHDLATTFAIEPFQDLLVGVIMTPLLISLYAAAFDQVMGEAAGVGRLPADRIVRPPGTPPVTPPAQRVKSTR
ncbi:hypothetical protein FOE78_16100 [Microlunatus elymi]|uniref:Uncharacterized protein n=1 Tax=Microlunatus elymi TaxID=2596828 RepID=A0A516Q1I2_9ACTN|nr:hypothetical protein [Microlunatus elymi]QDP97242.1 hypothetical protein FOE78_16100 [Microlunatus elymi]